MKTLEKRKRTLFVKETTNKEISDNWGFNTSFTFAQLYIACNKKGEVNWSKASVYSLYALEKRTNYKIIPNEKN